MLEKLIIIYTFITTLNSANKLSTWAVLNGHYNQGVAEATEENLWTTNNMETWQPIIQPTRNWLAQPTTATAATLTKLATSKSTLQSTNFRRKLAGKTFSQQYQHLTHKPSPTNNHLAYEYREGNYSKFHQRASATASFSMSSNLTNFKLKPYLLHRQQPLSSYQQHHPNHHYPAKYIAESVYPKIPFDILSQGQKPHMNYRVSNVKPHVTTDVNQHEKHEQNEQQQHPQHHSLKSLSTFDNTNAHNPTGSITLTNPFNMFENNNIGIDSKLKNSKTYNIRRSDDDVENNVANLNENLLLLQTTFDNAKELYESMKDIIVSDMDNVDEFFSSEDEIDDYELPMLNLKPDDVVTAKSSTTSALTEEIPLNKKHIKLSAASAIGEVQGHKRQIGNGTSIMINYNNSLIPSLLASPSSSSVLTIRRNVTDGRATQAEITARGFMVNKSSTPSRVSSLQTVGTDRKIKKLKKKFQKFLLPLVLAYKLKFLTLIPLLIGGLTLLVGTTGLAGFFFALFTAVMTLKSGSRNAIVVKKY